MKNTIVLTEMKDETRTKLKAINGYDFRFINPGDITDEDLEWVQVFVGDPTKEMIEKAVHLEWIQTDTAGINAYLDLDPKITVSNAYGAYGEGIGEYLTAAVLMADHRLDQYLRVQKYREWNNLGYGKGTANMKVLSVGMGSIGTAFLRRMHLLGSKCYGVRRTIHDKPDFVTELYTQENVDSILPQMDVIASSMPETPSTVGFFDYRRLHLMKKDAIFLNVGRGSAVVENDLIRTLDEGWFTAVILDVTEHEPLPKNSKLWNEERVLITPHISGRYNNPANYDSVMQVIIDNLKNASEGKPLKHVIDKNHRY